MKNTIYWFSGTGNSLYAAKVLAAAMGDTALEQIADGASTPEAVGGEGSKIGIVFPSYYGNIPRLVRAFAEKLNILPGTDLFTVVTMAAFSGQGSVKAMEELFSKKGHSLRFGVGVKMPANYIIKYNPAISGAKSNSRINSKLNKTDEQLQKIAADIMSGARQIKKGPISVKTLYKNVQALDADFYITEKCTSCAMCERLCPASNIKLENGKPTWQHRCEHCVACISWCPSAAIENGQKTIKRTRYRNPRVKPEELER